MIQRSVYKQRGMSLISLMIAMLIGVFLIGGIVKIYADSKSGFRTRNAVSEVAENQRFALDDMRRILVMTGREIRGLEDQYPNTRPFMPMAATGTVENGPGGRGDTIAIRYRRGPSCGAYQNIPVGNPPTEVRFFVDGNNQLVCELNGVSSVLATNVLRLEVLYGVDTDNDGYADQYSAANVVDALTPPTGSATAWARVVTVRLGILAGSMSTLPREAQPTLAELGPPPTVLNTALASWPADATSRIYKTASTTISLRNLNTVVQRQ